MKVVKSFNWHTVVNWLIPEKSTIVNHVQIGLMILIGTILIMPIIKRGPLLGWDWFFFFNRNLPDHIAGPNSSYPPFAPFLIQLVTWLDWRQSLALVNSLMVMSVAIGTWKNGGRYGSIAFGLLTPPLWMLLWIGHPE